MKDKSENQDLVAVTNGSKCVQLPISKVADAKADGFYVPADRGRTLIRHGNLLFEISSGEVDAAISSGGCDLLTIPNKPSTATEKKQTAAEVRSGEQTADTTSNPRTPPPSSLARPWRVANHANHLASDDGQWVHYRI